MEVDAKILDGAVVVNMLPTNAVSTFHEYIDDTFIPYVKGQLHSVDRIDLVWDVYIDNSLKESTRDMGGTGTRRRVVPSARLPVNWKGFLRVSANKAELFSLLAERIAMECVAGKQIISTFGNNVLSSPQREDTSTIEPCNHEEADTRIICWMLLQVDIQD